MSDAKVFDRRTLREGEVLIREGDLGDVAYFIQSGLFEVVKHGYRNEVLLTHLGRNAIVGEMALIDNNRRSATVRCVHPGTVVTIDRTSFDNRLKRLDKFTRALLEMFSSKLRVLNDEYLTRVRALPHTPAPPATASHRSPLNELLEAWGRADPEERRVFWQTVLAPEREQ